jgi:hypothetical protein
MIRNLSGDCLPDWMDRVREDNLLALHSSAHGLRQDLAAVTAGLPAVEQRPHGGHGQQDQAPQEDGLWPSRISHVAEENPARNVGRARQINPS